MGAARRRNLGADDINGFRSAPAGVCGPFGRFAEHRRPHRDDRVVQAPGIVRTGHARIQVYLHEPRLDVAFHEAARLGHRGGGAFVRPADGAQVVAAQHDSINGNSRPFRNAGEIRGKVARLHARVAAELIHLVGRRLDEQRRPVDVGLHHGGFEHQRMRAANRPDADGISATVAAQHVEQFIQGAFRLHRVVKLFGPAAASTGKSCGCGQRASAKVASRSCGQRVSATFTGRFRGQRGSATFIGRFRGQRANATSTGRPCAR